jgi:hypothetical protein
MSPSYTSRRSAKEPRTRPGKKSVHCQSRTDHMNCLKERQKIFKKKLNDMTELNRLHFTTLYHLGGAGGARIETGQYSNSREGIPQRHVLPLPHHLDHKKRDQLNFDDTVDTVHVHDRAVPRRRWIWQV